MGDVDYRILVVDDKEKLRKITRMHLESELPRRNKSIQVYEAANGIEALEIWLVEQRINRIITDLGMPNLGKTPGHGEAFIERVRKYGYKDRPILVITGAPSLAKNMIKLDYELLVKGKYDINQVLRWVLDGTLYKREDSFRELMRKKK